ncbi:MAG: pyridoxamine 5'-phosphate oxidase family protein [Clostridia bacterium]|nr:pyridoxamine 5'-phosphate oxidase family protein [Clostridia bacterium]
MRRSDREVTERAAIAAIIQACDCCRLGFVDDAGAYILPLNFGFAQDAAPWVLYFHGAAEGKKIDLIKAQPHVSFEMDTHHTLNTASAACGFSFGFQSVMGQGDIALVEDADEKARALNCIMAHYTDRADWAFPAEALSHTAIMRLSITALSCKVHA